MIADEGHRASVARDMGLTFAMLHWSAEMRWLSTHRIYLLVARGIEVLISCRFLIFDGVWSRPSFCLSGSDEGSYANRKLVRNSPSHSHGCVDSGSQFWSKS